LTGHIPGRFIGPLFSICDVYASASEMEGFGTSVMQAAASGTAVVCTEMTPVAVHYLSEEAAIVPAGEVYDFARAIQNLLDDEDVREERSRALKQKVKAFDWEVQVNAFIAYLRSRGIPAAKTQTHLKSKEQRTVRGFPASAVAATARRSANMQSPALS
jgi:glycosyltransferase involved in cell wall biosynthesis